MTVDSATSDFTGESLCLLEFLAFSHKHSGLHCNVWVPTEVGNTHRHGGMPTEVGSSLKK